MGSRSRSWFGAPAPATALSKAPGPHRDPYLDPHTGILTDLIGACTTIELATAEADPVTAHIRQLFRHPPAPTRDLAELQAIHRLLFQDIYPWAGQLRCRGSAQNDPGGAAVPAGVDDHPLGRFRLRSSGHSRRLVAELDPVHRGGQRCRLAGRSRGSRPRCATGDVRGDPRSRTTPHSAAFLTGPANGQTNTGSTPHWSRTRPVSGRCNRGTVQTSASRRRLE